MSEEDIEINAAVKAAFEDGASLNAPRVNAIMAIASRQSHQRKVRRGLLLWGVTSLLAASLAVVVAFQAIVHRGDNVAAGNAEGVKDTIGLLCALDGISAEGLSALSAGELLLAWQEAPCADLL